MRGEAELDEESAEDGFNQCECDDGDGGGAREMSAHGSCEGPDEKADGGEEGDAAGDAMGELDECVRGGGVLEDGSVAEGPVVSAAGSGTGGADDCSPEDDGDEVGEDGPGKVAESWRWKWLQGGGRDSMRW